MTAFVTRLSEVKTLAKLNHPNIVQYKAAWLEPLFNVTHTLPPADVTTLNDSDSDGIIFKDSNSSSSSSSPLSSENKEVGTGLVVCEYKRSKFFQQKSISQVCIKKKEHTSEAGLLLILYVLCRLVHCFICQCNYVMKHFVSGLTSEMHLKLWILLCPLRS